MAFEGQLHEAVEELLVGEAARGPELRVDARRGEARDGVDLVYEQPGCAAFEEEVHARHARRVYGLEGLAGYAPYLLRGLVRDEGWSDELHPALHVLRLVIVELVFLDDDLAWNGDLGVLVAQDGDLDLPGVDALFDDDAPVQTCRFVDGVAEFPCVLRLADADARSEVSGLDEAWVSEGVFDLSGPTLSLILPLLARK